ncbi:MAG: hypothetical protein AABZ30_07470 [Myxococcota bacterium]
MAACNESGAPRGGGLADAGATLTIGFSRVGGDAPVAVERAALRFASVRLAGDAGAVEVHAESIDLFDDARISLPDVAPGIYSRIRLRLGTHDESGTAAIYLAGSWQGHFLLLTDYGGGETTLRSREGFLLAAGGAVEIVVDVDLDAWFEGVDLSSAWLPPASEAILLASEGDNAELTRQVRERVIRSFSIRGEPSVADAESDLPPSDAGPDATIDASAVDAPSGSDATDGVAEDGGGADLDDDDDQDGGDAEDEDGGEETEDGGEEMEDGGEEMEDGG